MTIRSGFGLLSRSWYDEGLLAPDRLDKDWHHDALRSLTDSPRGTVRIGCGDGAERIRLPASFGAERSAAPEPSFFGMSRPLRLVASDDTSVPAPLTETRRFEDFFEAESGTLYRRLCLVTGNRHEAEEVMQDAFISVLERWDRVSVMENPTGYLYRTAFRAVHKRSRRAARAARHLVLMRPEIDDFAAAEDREIVRRALGELSRRQRVAVILTELLGFSSEEAGAIMGTRPVTVRVLASQGRATMRRILEGPDE